MRLLLLERLEGHGWDFRQKDGGTELRDWEGDVFAVARKVKKVYPMELKVKTPLLAAWMEIGDRTELTRKSLRVNEPQNEHRPSTPLVPADFCHLPEWLG